MGFYRPKRQRFYWRLTFRTSVVCFTHSYTMRMCWFIFFVRCLCCKVTALKNIWFELAWNCWRVAGSYSYAFRWNFIYLRARAQANAVKQILYEWWQQVFELRLRPWKFQREVHAKLELYLLYELKDESSVESLLQNTYSSSLLWNFSIILPSSSQIIWV